MNKQLAFVLSGGGARGALQVGALHALFEHGFQPDLLVGTSIGAVNATFLALHCYSKQSLDLLTSEEILAVLLVSNVLSPWVMPVRNLKILFRQSRYEYEFSFLSDGN